MDVQELLTNVIQGTLFTRQCKDKTSRNSRAVFYSATLLMEIYPKEIIQWKQNVIEINMFIAESATIVKKIRNGQNVQY